MHTRARTHTHTHTLAHKQPPYWEKHCSVLSRLDLQHRLCPTLARGLD